LNKKKGDCLMEQTMGIKVALGILNPKGESLENLVSARNAALQKWHPDHAGQTAETLKMTRAILEAFNVLNANISKWSMSWGPTEKEATGEHHVFAEMMEILRKINHLPGIVIERRGVWLWVFGNTKPVKDQLKAAGFAWGKKAGEWWWRPDWSASKKVWKNRRTWTPDEKRAVFGYERFEKEERSALG
jgi:hypothetical protein